MTIGQYRALVAYMNYWTPRFPWMNLNEAISDIGITDSRDDIILELWKAGHHFDEETGLLVYDDE
jgi:hypothetical protein